MPSTLIDDFSSSVLWNAFQPGAIPSTEVLLADDMETTANFPDGTSLRIEVTGTAATDHYIERFVLPTDLSSFSELGLWIRSSVRADGTSDHPFLLRMEMGSAAMAIGAPGNDWHRYLPSPDPNRWSFVRLAIDDLDPLVAGGMDTLRFTVTDATHPWTGWIDNLIAATPAMIEDVDTALRDLLDGVLTIGVPVPAQIHLPGAPEPADPWIRLVHYDLSYSDSRAIARRPRTDFTDTGYRIAPEVVAYDLFYRVEPVTTDRNAHASILEFLLDTLGYRGTLLVNGERITLERVESVPRDIWGDMPILRYRVSTWRSRGAPQHVTPVTDIALETDLAP